MSQNKQNNKKFFEKYDDHNDPPMDVTPPKNKPPPIIMNNYVMKYFFIFFFLLFQSTFEQEQIDQQQVKKITLESQKASELQGNIPKKPIVRPQPPQSQQQPIAPTSQGAKGGLPPPQNPNQNESSIQQHENSLNQQSQHAIQLNRSFLNQLQSNQQPQSLNPSQVNQQPQNIAKQQNQSPNLQVNQQSQNNPHQQNPNQPNPQQQSNQANSQSYNNQPQQNPQFSNNQAQINQQFSNNQPQQIPQFSNNQGQMNPQFQAQTNRQSLNLQGQMNPKLQNNSAVSKMNPNILQINPDHSNQQNSQQSIAQNMQGNTLLLNSANKQSLNVSQQQPMGLSQIIESNDPKEQILQNFLEQDKDNYVIFTYDMFVSLPLFKQELIYKSMCNKILRCKEKLDKFGLIYNEPQQDQLQQAVVQLQNYLNNFDNLQQMHQHERTSAKSLLERFSGLIESSRQEIVELKNKIAKYEQQNPLKKTSFIQQSSYLQQQKNKNYQRIKEEQNYLQYDQIKEQKVDELKEQLKQQIEPVQKDVEAYEYILNSSYQHRNNVENNKNQMMSLVQEINYIRSRQNESRDLEEKKQMLTRIGHIQHAYEQINAEKKLVELEINQINERYSKLHKCSKLSKDLIGVYEEFKEIYDSYKDQKFKMQDYEQIFTKMIDSNRGTLSDVKKLEQMQQQQNLPENQQHPSINEYLGQLPNFGVNKQI